MTFKYRCSKCRGRNCFKHLLDWYLRKRRCRHCGHDRFYLDRARQFRDDYCTCSGYHYTHRKGSTFCEHHPNYQVNVRVGRYGEKLEDVLEDIKLRAICPF